MYKFTISLEEEVDSVENTLLVLDGRMKDSLDELGFLTNAGFYDIYVPNMDNPNKIVRCVTYI